MLISTPAIVLNTIPYGDTSVIAHLFSLQRGLLGVIIKGARGNKKSRKQAILQVLTIVEIHINLRENKDLHFLKEIRLLHPYTGIPFSTPKTAQALFIAELLRKSIKEEEKNVDLYEFITNSLMFLDESTRELPAFHLKFMLDLSKHLGFYPENNFDEKHPYFQFTDGVFHHSFGDTCLVAEASHDIHRLMNCSFSDLENFSLRREQRKVLLRNLMLFYLWHMPSFKELQTPDVLEDVFG